MLLGVPKAEEEEEVHARLPCFLPAVAAAGSRTRRATSAVRICDVADGLKKPSHGQLWRAALERRKASHDDTPIP